jgi:hypothetical protein
MNARQSRLIPLLTLFAAAVVDAGAPTTVTPGQNQIYRSQAAKVLASRTDANSLVTAAALRFAGSNGKARVKPVSSDAQKSALELITQAGEQAPQSSAIAWLHLQICSDTPGCSTPEVATVMRWIDADNGASWLPILATAQKDKDSVEVARVLDDMAQAPRFDLYLNRLTVVMFDVLKAERHALPGNYAASDWARFTEVTGIATTETIPSFTALIEVCRDLTAARYHGTQALAGMARHGRGAIRFAAHAMGQEHAIAGALGSNETACARRRCLHRHIA